MVARRTGASSVCKARGVLWAVLGLIYGALFNLFSLMGVASVANSQSSGALAGSVIFLPIFYDIAASYLI